MKSIQQVDHIKFLAAIIDSKLTRQKHVQYVTSKISKTLCVINRLRYTLGKDGLVLLYHCLIHSHLIYCIELWGSAAKTH